MKRIAVVVAVVLAGRADGKLTGESESVDVDAVREFVEANAAPGASAADIDAIIGTVHEACTGPLTQEDRLSIATLIDLGGPAEGAVRAGCAADRIERVLNDTD